MRGRGALLGILVTIVCLYLALRNVDLTAVGQELATADYRFLLPAAGCTLAGYLVRTLRWQQILAPLRRLGWGLLFRVLMLGFAANNILPARVGEVVRAYSLSRKAGVSAGLSLATILVERVFDGLTLLLLMALALRVAPVVQDDPRLRLVEVVSVVVFLSALVVMILLLVLRERALALLGWCLQPLPAGPQRRLLDLAASFVEGLVCLRHAGAVVRVSLLSLLVWSLEGASYALVARAFNLGLQPADYLGAILFLVVFVNLGIMVPSAPGYVGTFQLFAWLALTAFDVPGERALGLAVASHAIQYLLVTGIGLLVLWREQLSLTRLVGAPAPIDPAGQ